LSPTKELIDEANENWDYNDSSYVVKYIASNWASILFCWDSHNKTWEHLLKNHEKDISSIDILIAPHHWRKSGRTYDFLDIVKPKVTFFWNAKSKDLAYDAWNYRELEFFTNNQWNCLIAQFLEGETKIFCSYKSYAEAYNDTTYFSKELDAYYLTTI